MLDSPITAAVGRRSNWVPHAVLWIGVFITAFPLYVTFVASTLLPQDIAQVPMQLFPGSHGWDNYREAWSKGSAGTYLSPPAATLRVGLLHGRVKPEARDRVMQAFTAGDIDVLMLDKTGTITQGKPTLVAW